MGGGLLTLGPTYLLLLAFLHLGDQDATAAFRVGRTANSPKDNQQIQKSPAYRLV